MAHKNKKTSPRNKTILKRKKPVRRRGVLLGFGILVVLAAGWIAWQAYPKAPKIRNVLLISIDTCRADYLSCYGHPRETTPRLDALARESSVFSEAVANVPLTLPSHCTMMTGMLPPSHGVRYNIKYRLGASSLTLAEILKDKRYRTGAVIGAFVLDSRFGLNQGFDDYDDKLEQNKAGAPEDNERPGGEVSRLAGEWLDKNHDKPFFLFVHYYDPHREYTPPEPYATQFKDDPYAGEIAYVDHCIGTVLDKLKELRLYDSSLIVVVGDHGEGLGQHNEREHGFLTYQSTLRVPLMIKRPGRKDGRWIRDQRVSVADVAPTILGCVGIPVPRRMQGRDLARSLDGGTPAASYEHRQLYFETLLPTQYECAPPVGLVSAAASPGENWKYIESLKPELYDLSKDPGEKTNLISADPARAESLRNALAEIRKAITRTPGGETELKLDRQSIERLEKLGYLAGGSLTADATPEGYREDAKDFISVFYEILDLADLIAKRQYAQARAAAMRIRSERPELAEIHNSLGTIARKEGKMEEAVAHFSAYLALAAKARKSGKYAGPPPMEEAGVLSDLGSALLLLGRIEEATERFRLASDLAPDVPEIHKNLGALLWKQGLFKEAARHFEACLKLDPNQPLVREWLKMAGSNQPPPRAPFGAPRP
jgi:arylsulfatase A-like enzyme